MRIKSTMMDHNQYPGKETVPDSTHRKMHLQLIESMSVKKQTSVRPLEPEPRKVGGRNTWAVDKSSSHRSRFGGDGLIAGLAETPLSTSHFLL